MSDDIRFRNPPDADLAVEYGRLVQVTRDNNFFDEPEPDELESMMSPRDRRALEVRREALRYILKIGNESLTQRATALGVTRAALSIAHRRILIALGAGVGYRRARKRAKLGAV
jgi:hypothetical protein